MRTHLLRKGSAAALLAALSLTTIAATTTYVPKTEQLYIRIGCTTADGSGTGTCATTEYFLSRYSISSTSTVGSSREFTPQSYALDLIGTKTWQSYTPDVSVAPTYVLRGGQQVTGQMWVTGPGGISAGADATLEVELSATNSATNQSVLLGSATVKKTVVANDNKYEFSFTVPQNLEKVSVKNLLFRHTFRGLHAGTNGWIDGNARSYFTLPYYEVVTTP